MYSRRYFVSILLIVITSNAVFADSATQTDWSGGDGIQGPVLDWDQKFYQYSSIDWIDNPGILLLTQVFLMHNVENNFANVNSIHANDFDGDGDYDILGSSGVLHDIAWWENTDGSGTSWTKHFVDMNFYSIGNIHSVDINVDGDIDVIGAGNDMVVWWENDNGSGTSWTEHTIETYFDGAYWLYSEDINGDGYMDVLSAAESSGYIIWWQNSDSAPGIYWTKHIVSDGNFYMSIHSDDIDGDGDMDVLSGARQVNDITWYENDDGSGTSWTEHIIDGDVQYPDCVYSADINGDGDMDVLGGAPWAYAITWWDVTGYSSDGSLESSILDIECSPEWAGMDWNCSEPAGVDLYFQYRTSDDPGSMGNWSDPIHEPCFLNGLVDRYFQYRISMETTDPYSSPLLYDFTLNWDPLGIEGDPCISGYEFQGASPNPAFGTVRICFGVPELSPVSLTVFDLSGRLVNMIQDDEYSPGFHNVQLDELSPGIYFCRMVSGDFEATKRFVVVQ